MRHPRDEEPVTTPPSTVCMRCDWRPDPDALDDAGEPISRRMQLLDHALDAGHPLCCSCGRSLSGAEPQTCEDCLVDARALLSGVVTMWAELPRHLTAIAGQAYDQPRVAGTNERALPGGNVLALLAPGGTGTAARRLTPLDVQRGLTGREHGQDNHPEDAPSVAAVLARWEDDFRHQRGEPAAVVYGGTSAVVRHASRYLEVHARWAATSSADFADFHTEMRELHNRLEQATSRRRTPVKAGADCFDCGGPLERPLHELTANADVYPWWIPGGIGPRRQQDLPDVRRAGLVEDEDFVTCRRCGARYDGARYLLALAARRQDGLQGWVSVPAAALASSRPIKTVRAWLGQHVPWALRIEPRDPTPDNPSPWRTVEQVAWFPALHDRAARTERRPARRTSA